MRGGRRLQWLGAAVVGALALAVASGAFALDVAPIIVSARSTMDDLRQISSQDFAAPADRASRDLQYSVARLTNDLKPASRTMGWLGRFSPSLSGLPGAAPEVRAWAAQAARLSADAESGATVLDAYTRLLEAYGEAQASLLGDGGKATQLLGSDPDALEAAFRGALETGGRASRAGHSPMPLLSTPWTRDTLALLDAVEQRISDAAKVGEEASRLLDDLAEVAEGVRPLMAQFAPGDGPVEPLDLAGLKTSLTALDERLKFARTRLDQVLRLVADGEASSVFEPALLLRDLLGVLAAVNNGTVIGLQVVGGALAATEVSDPGLLGDDGTLLRLFDDASRQSARLDQAIAVLEDGARSLSKVRSGAVAGDYARGLDDLESVIGLLSDGFKVLRDFGPMGPGLVGADSARRYLVLGQSADELRATGGFVSSVWLVTFEDGALADVRYHDVTRVDSIERFDLYPPAPAGLEEHMFAHTWLLRDVSWEPDFPTTARTAADMYRIGQQLDVDGVIALNQWTLLAFLQGLGGIEAPGAADRLTDRNFLTKLEQATDEHGRAYMDLALQGIMDRLSRPTPLSTIMKIASAFQTSLDQRDLLLFHVEPEIQDVIRRNGWGGSVGSSVSDYLYVVDSNVGWSKADRNIERTVTYQADLSKARPRIDLTLGYNNYSGRGSAVCNPQWANEGTDYSALKNACYWDFWRVYVPRGARLLASTPLPLPEYSVSALIGRRQPGDDTVSVSSGYDKTVFSGLFDLEAGAEKEIKLVYDLPAAAMRLDGDDIRYSVLIQKQPGIRWRDLAIELIMPTGYRLKSSSFPPSWMNGSHAGFALRIRQDTTLEAVLTKGNDDPA